MDNLSIYSLSDRVIGLITSDLNHGIYARLDGELSFAWSDLGYVTAWAESKQSPKGPPKHRIVISYELTRRLYREVELYYEYMHDSRYQHGFAHAVLSELDIIYKLPSEIVKEDWINNCFISALSWVYFHELGHLLQEHGFIRSKFSEGMRLQYIEDCESNSDNPLHGRNAIVSHVTEFAADVEATQFCIKELVRQFIAPGGYCDKIAFEENLFLFVSGISCAFYIFNGNGPIEPSPHPEGSHPTPLRRLEMCLPNVFENLDLNGNGEEIHGLNRKELVGLCVAASTTVSFFWLSKATTEAEMSDFVHVKGIAQDPHFKTYWKEMIEIWDEILPEVRRISRYESPFGMMSFTSTFRDMIESN